MNPLVLQSMIEQHHRDLTRAVYPRPYRRPRRRADGKVLAVAWAAWIAGLIAGGVLF